MKICLSGFEYVIEPQNISIATDFKNYYCLRENQYNVKRNCQ